jgi:hypothetical protein
VDVIEALEEALVVGECIFSFDVLLGSVKE